MSFFLMALDAILLTDFDILFLFMFNIIMFDLIDLIDLINRF